MVLTNRFLHAKLFSCEHLGWILSTWIHVIASVQEEKEREICFGNELNFPSEFWRE